MSDKPPQTLTQEERLQALVYKFLQLYDRLSEERLMAAKQNAEIAEVVNALTEQVKHFEALEGKVRQEIAVNIRQAAAKAAQTVGKELQEVATPSMEEAKKRLIAAAERAEQVIQQTQRDAKSMVWFSILGLFALPIIVSLLTVWLLIPKPTYPLTDRQLTLLTTGYQISQIWDKLSKKEQARLGKLSDEAEHPAHQNEDGTNSDTHPST